MVFRLRQTEQEAGSLGFFLSPVGDEDNGSGDDSVGDVSAPGGEVFIVIPLLACKREMVIFRFFMVLNLGGKRWGTFGPSLHKFR